MAEDRIYIAIDLKSFFASVECRERDLDPLNTNLVVADAARTEKTICLAVTPSLSPMVFPAEPAFLKSYSVCGRKIKSGQRQHRGTAWRALPIYMTICKRIHPLRLII